MQIYYLGSKIKGGRPGFGVRVIEWVKLYFADRTQVTKFKCEMETALVRGRGVLVW